MLGRRRELRAAARCVTELRAGTGRVLLVTGEPGIGRTTLLRAIAEHAGARGVRVLSGSGRPAGVTVPFATIARLIGSPLVGPADARATAAKVLAMIGGWCASSPVALVLDDAQWLDPASLFVLQELAATTRRSPLLIILALRPLPRRRDVHDALAEHARTIRLGPLDQHETTGLVELAVGGPIGARFAAAIGQAAGNPCYLKDLVSTGRARGVLVNRGNTVELVAEPSELTTAIPGRLGFLDDRATAALRTAALPGPALSAADLAAALEHSLTAMTSTVDDLVTVGLLEQDDGLLRFRHGAVRLAVLGSLGTAVRHALHHQLAKALRSAGAAVEVVAEHLLAAGRLDTGDLTWLLSCAPLVLTSAPTLGVELLRRAAGSSSAGALRAEVRVRYAEALLHTGSPAHAENELRLALREGEDIPLRRLLLRSLDRQGRVGQAVLEARHALETSTDDAWLQGFLAQSHWLLGEVEMAEWHAEIATARGDNLGRSVSAATRLLRYEVTDALALSAPTATEPSGDHLSAHLVRGRCLIERDRLAEADAAFDAGIGYCTAAGSSLALPAHHLGKAQVRLLDGRWEEALSEVDSVAGPDDHGFAAAAMSLAALIAAHRGEPVVHAPQGAQTPTGLGYLGPWARAVDLEAAGQPERALTELLAHWENGPQSLLCADLARLAFLAEDRLCSKEIARRIAILAHREPAPHLAASESLCSALSTMDHDECVTAARRFRVAGRPLFEGYAHENAAVLAARKGIMRTARTHATLALGVYQALGAQWDLARTRGRLRSEGVRLGSVGPRSRPSSGWFALTATEARVASLVAKGCTNPEIGSRLFVSPRTVQAHVSSILGKLGLTSRVEIATAALRSAPTDPPGQ